LQNIRSSHKYIGSYVERHIGKQDKVKRRPSFFAVIPRNWPHPQPSPLLANIGDSSTQKEERLKKYVRNAAVIVELAGRGVIQRGGGG
jgi:hypothetical protein